MQNKDFQIAIVEDDSFVSLDLVDRLESLGFSNLKVFDSGEGLLKVIKSLKPKIVLMDIELSGDLDGIETVSKIRKINSIPVIYLTDHVDDNTFQRALETSPSAFLHKPFIDKQIAQNIEIAISQENEDFSHEQSSMLVLDGLFAYESQGRYQKVPLTEIRFMKAERAYCQIALADESLTVSRSMKTVLKVLSKSEFKDRFIQVHRSYVVNKDHISGFNARTLLIDNQSIPTTDHYIPDLKALFFTV
ncbi:response regulator [Fulvivirgaceae bacterium BMA10]|uniref:Response regulator n=1 Tax=Splendidivirga corallicola TaxID=3051826 RepID=A0ABT8KM01_9BACT|nr:response regulator [Fulvivirgaceae bacterium BMA10]